jgi:DeoR family myo-inositol catabolism operon transcriptional repressor
LNKAFIATTGLTIKSGATNPDNAEALIKTNMMKRSSESYLLVDSSKFDQTSLVTFASINDFYMIITSGSVPQYYFDYFTENNIQFKIT